MQLFLCVDSSASYPVWGPWMSNTADGFTIRFRISTGIVNGGKVRFEAEVSVATQTLLLGGYTVSLREDDWPAYPTRYTYSGPIGNVSGTFFTYSGFTTDPCSDLGSGSGFYLQLHYSFTGIGYRDLDTPFYKATNYGDDAYEHNDTYSAAYNIGSGSTSASQLILSDDVDWYKFTATSDALKYTITMNNFFDVAGNFNLYLYSSSDLNNAIGSSVTSTNEEIITTILPGPGTYYIKAISSDGGKGFYDLKLVASCVIPGQPGNINGSTNPCQGSSQTYSISTVTGATSYVWSLPTGWQGTSSANSIDVIVGAGSGNISVKAHNSCGDGTARTLAVSVSPLPGQPGVISGPANICVYSNQTYSISAVSGADDYTWILPSGWNGNSYSTSIDASAGSAGGTIYVMANNGCGTGASRTINVSIIPIPGQPGSISGSSNVCQGSTQTYSVSSVSGASFYTWYLPSGWSGYSATNSISVTAGTNNGTIRVTASNSCGEGAERSKSITVGSPVGEPGAITGETNVCQGTQKTYSIAPVAGATSYTWNLPTGWSGTSSSSSIVATVGSSSGNITVIPSSACGPGNSSTLLVTVNPVMPQPGAISGSTTVCQGSTQTYSVPAVPGATSYTWSLPTGWNGNSSTNSITTTIGATGGDISVIANNSCGPGPSRTLTIIVTPLVAQPGSLSGLKDVCQNSPQVYSVSPVNGATSYTWTLPSGWTGSSSESSINATSGTTGGTITVKAINSCGSGNPASLNVTVSSTPVQPGSISGNTTVCQGSSQTYSITPVTGASSYTWSMPAGWTGTSSAASITAIPGAAGGIVSVAMNNGCGTSTASTLTVTSNPLPIQPGTITGNTSVCQGSSQTYTISPVAGASSYQWTLPSGWTGNSATTSISAIAGTTGGNISVAAVNTCGPGTSRTLAVTVTPVPGQPGTITGTQDACQGSQQIYSIAPVTGADSYTWTLPAGWSGTSSASSITATTGASGGVISVAANGTCGTSVIRTLNITVSQPPVQPGAIAGSTTVCQGSSQTYSVTAVTGASSYIWSLPAGWTGSSNSGSITVVPGSAGGNISVSTSNGCGTSAASTLNITVNPLPAQPGTISGAVTVCQGSTQTFSIAAVPGAGSYTWVLPDGWSGTSSTNSITTVIGSASGNVTVKANNQCGAGPERNLAVTVNPLPDQPAAVAGNGDICQSTTQTYSIAAVTGATSYTWTLPAGWTGASTSASITAVAGTSGGTVSVAANNGCGAGTPKALAVSVSQPPVMPGTISGSTIVCSDSPQVYSIEPVAGATSYTWTIPTGWTGTSTTPSVTLTAGSAGGTISVKTNNACGSSSAKTLSVTIGTPAPQPGPITGSTTVCEGASRTYSISAVSGTTSYTWTLPAGWTGSSSSTSINATAGAAGGAISVTANNNCGPGNPRTINVSVNPLPGQPAQITGKSPVCQGSIQSYTIQAVSGATSYTWSLPEGWSGSSTGTSISATAGATGGTISVRANNSCGPGRQISLNVIVTPLLDKTGTISGNTVVCKGTTVSYSVIPVSGATSYEWILPAGWTGSSASQSISATVGDMGGEISVKAKNSCGSGTASILKVEVSLAVAQPGAITGSVTVCPESSQTYSITPVSGATSYTWTLPYGWTGSSTTASITTRTGMSGGIISVAAVNGCGSGTVKTLTTEVNQLPQQPGYITGSASVCANTDQIYSINPVAGATSYTWTLPAGWSGTSTTRSINLKAGTTGGTVSVAANNSCGAGPAQTMIIAVKPQPVTPVISLKADTILISDSDTGNQWYNTSGPIAGAVASEFMVKTTGDYFVTVTSNGCVSAPSNTINVIIKGIEDALIASLIKIYPNPADDVLIVENESALQMKKLEVYDSYGKLMLVLNDPVQRTTINLDHFPSGIYILKLYGLAGSANVRFIKM